MAGAAVLVGLPMFFEIGLVLLIPIVLMVARRSKLPMLAVAIPALAGLSVLHGLVPPHPGPLTAIGLLHADLGLTLLYGIIVALPTVVLAGPVWGRICARWGPQDPPDNSVIFNEGGAPAAADGSASSATRKPSFLVTLVVVLLPVVLMLARAVAEIVSKKGNPVHDALFLVGTPLIALLIGTLAAMALLGLRTGMGWGGLAVSVDKSLPPMAGTLLIIAAGGGFKQTLVDAGVGNLVADWAKGVNFNVLVLGWLVAVGIRLATGSATVATITSAGIVGPLAAQQSSSEVALLVLALGCGSLFFSHVNDVGFWLVKQYFGMTVKQTILSWSLMETIISVAGLVFVLILSAVVT
jgi:GntP family gluconate:H+ symporter